jgi:hypothetical protein
LRNYVKLKTGDCESESRDAEPASGCGCPQKVVLLKDAEVEFDGLDLEEEYFPMVSAAGSQAIYGHPPLSLRPSQPLVQRSHHARSSTLSPSAAGLSRNADSPGDNDYNDLYGVSDDEDTGATTEVDTSSPVRTSSSKRSKSRGLLRAAEHVTQSQVGRVRILYQSKSSADEGAKVRTAPTNQYPTREAT